MSSIIGCTDNGCQGQGFCPAVLRGIENVNGLNNPSFLVEPVGTLQALFDPSNRDMASFDEINGRSGEVRQIRVKRLPRGNHTEAVGNSISCAPTTTAGYTDDIICVNRKASINFSITSQQMQAYCAESLRVGTTGNLPTFMLINELLMSKMHALRQFINRDIISVIEANRGINVVHGTTAPQSVGLIDGTTGAKIEWGYQTISHELAQNNVRGQWLVTGFGVWDRFNTSIQYGCCNQFGLDWNAMSQAANYRYYQDFDIADVLNEPNQINIFAPGAVQFVYYNDTILGQGAGQRWAEGKVGVVPDPFVPGLVYDIALIEGLCEEGEYAPSVKVLLYLNYDLSFIPETAYAVGDRMRTPGGIVNGIFSYDAVTV